MFDDVVKCFVDIIRADALEMRLGCKICIEFRIDELAQYIYFLYLMLIAW